MSTLTVAVVSAGLSEPSSTKLLADRLAQAVRREGARRGLRIDVVDVPLRGLARPIANSLRSTGTTSSPRMSSCSRTVFSGRPAWSMRNSWR